MKRHIIILISLALPAFAAIKPPQEMPLDMTSSEYHKMYQEFRQHRPFSSESTTSAALENVISQGERNLDWVRAINSTRDADHKILMSDKNSAKGYPIEQPKLNSEAIVLAEYNAWLATAEPTMRDVLSGKLPLTTQPVLPDDQMQVLVRKMDKFYQNATRWKMEQPYIGYYEANEANDIRGFYYLSRRADREAYLKNYAAASADDKKQIQEWLVQMCRNDGTPKSLCQSQLNREIAAQRDLNQFYAGKLNSAQNNWNNFFKLYFVRSDITHTNGSAELFRIPFTNPNNQNVINFLKLNVEDEWKGTGWNLMVDMVPSAQSHVEFVKGVTPHVSGGNTIVMDENQSLDDYENQWTIRHEFGHILGFPDCYIEFYNADLKAMVSYQLDITNLMCSRPGHLKQIHYDTLKAAYIN